MPPVLSVKHVTKHFGGVQALQGVSLDLHAGEIHCLAGENGSGKSTLIKILAGIHSPDEGTIVVRGDEHGHLHPRQALRLGIQTLYQDFSLFPNLSAAENLALPGLLEQRSLLIRWREVRRIAERALGLLGVHLDPEALVEELPVAQKQLVAIARALLHEALVIILDEPTSALTGVEVEALFTVVRRLRERGVAILFVSHKLREMLQVSDRFTILRNGGVVARGETAEFDAATITLHMTGRVVDETRSPPEPGRDDALLEVRHLTGEVVKDVGFELHPGEIVGLTGLLGSGQTELAEILFGLRRPRFGEVFIRGKRTELRSVRDAIAAGVAYVPEDRLTEGLFLEQPVEDNLHAASLDASSNRAGLLSPAKIREQVRHWLDALDIRTESPRAPAWALSGGNQQRVVLGRWLATAPALLILNGPTVGVDVGSRDGIHTRLRDLAAAGLGILLISDDLPELVETCHRVLVLHQGAVVDELRGEDCREEALALRLSRLE